MGARLANILWTWRLARKIGARTLAFWPPMPWYPGEGLGASELFDVAALATSPLRDELQIVVGRPQDHIKVELVELDPSLVMDPRQFVASFARKERVKLLQAIRGPLLMEGETAAEAAAEARELFFSLPFCRNVRMAFKEARGRHDLRRMVAVHYRRGDIIPALTASCNEFVSAPNKRHERFENCIEHYFRCCPPMKAYETILQPLVEQGFDILFCSDSPSLSARLAERFGPRVIAARDLAPGYLSVLQRALFELLLMSQCHAILGSKSVFGNLAAAISRGTFVDARFKSRPEEFIGELLTTIGYRGLKTRARSAVAAVVMDKINSFRLLEVWSVDEAHVQAILSAREPAAA